MRRIAWIVIVGMLAACPSDTGKTTDDGDEPSPTPSTSPTPTQSALSIEITDLTFTHTVSSDPGACPQLIGTVTITNASSASADATVAVSGSAASYPISFDPASGMTTVPAGGTATFTVYFDCSSRDDFTATLTVDVDNGTETNQQTAVIDGTINE